MKIRCRFGWHDWSNWEFVTKKNVYTDREAKYPTFEKMIYMRRCLDCDMSKIKTIKIK